VSSVHVDFDERGEVVEYVLPRRGADRTWLAMMLAPRVEICEALLRGEGVPLDRLDPEWVARFGRRES
jgi:hypothetical protein